MTLYNSLHRQRPLWVPTWQEPSWCLHQDNDFCTVLINKERRCIPGLSSPCLHALSPVVGCCFCARYTLFPSASFLVAWQHARLSNSTDCGEEQRTVLASLPFYVHFHLTLLHLSSKPPSPVSIFPHTYCLCTQTSTTTTMVTDSNKNKQLSEQALKQIEKKRRCQTGAQSKEKKREMRCCTEKHLWRSPKEP